LRGIREYLIRLFRSIYFNELLENRNFKTLKRSMLLIKVELEKQTGKRKFQFILILKKGIERLWITVTPLVNRFFKFI